MRPEKISRVRFMPCLILSKNPIVHAPLLYACFSASLSFTDTVRETPFSCIVTP